MVQQESKEPCKKEACYIQACLSKNNFLPEKLKNHIQTQPQIPNFLAEVDLPQAHPLDSTKTLRLKAESDFKDSLTRDRYIWLDIAQSLAQGSAARPVAESGVLKNQKGAFLRRTIIRRTIPSRSTKRCLKFIEQLQACCEKCNYNSKHCASVSSLLKQKHPQIHTHDD